MATDTINYGSERRADYCIRIIRGRIYLHIIIIESSEEEMSIHDDFRGILRRSIHTIVYLPLSFHSTSEDYFYARDSFVPAETVRKITT